MVNKTLSKATAVNAKIEKTIEENTAVMQKYDDENQRFNEKCSDMLDEQIRSQQAKYKHQRTVVEPNLSRRMEQRKERARMRAIQEEMISQQSNYADMPLELMHNDEKMAKMFNTYHGDLEKINEENVKMDPKVKQKSKIQFSERVNKECNLNN
jgi:hypothetical protein